jgi:hypothetical protein
MYALYSYLLNLTVLRINTIFLNAINIVSKIPTILINWAHKNVNLKFWVTKVKSNPSMQNYAGSVFIKRNYHVSPSSEETPLLVNLHRKTVLWALDFSAWPGNRTQLFFFILCLSQLQFKFQDPLLSSTKDLACRSVGQCLLNMYEAPGSISSSPKTQINK